MPRVAVFGLGQFGTTLAEALTHQGAEVLAFDTDPERVESVKELVAMAVQLDSTDERALRAVGLDQVQIAIVSIGTNIEANILTAALLKQLGVPRILARATTPIQERILRAIGVNQIINVEREMGEAIATTLALGEIHRFFTLATGRSIVEIDVPEHLIGKSIEEAQLRQRYSVNIVAIKKRRPDVDERGRRTLRDELSMVPKPTDRLEEGDLLVLAGENDDIQAVLRG
jgi:trk system potassium uptake protein TrkA